MRGLVVWLLLWAVPAWAVECRDLTYEGDSFTVCEVDAAREDMRLFLKQDAQTVWGHFIRIDEALAARGRKLAFAMNAGMYHADRAPVGLYSDDDGVAQGVIASAGPGNFGMLPNGVFCIGAGRADVVETLRFEAEQPDCRYASQSGPMLVIDGKLHPRFLPGSTSRYIRNGVGTSADGKRAVFVISNNAVTFHAFGSLFRNVLGVPNALYFDGNISRLHAPGLGRSDPGFPMGPIVGVVE